jgi:hypothetical protein
MNNEFVPYDIALAMKGLGFDDECFGCYTKDKEISLDYSDNKGEGHYFQSYAAPVYQQSFRWFREEHNHAGLIQLIEPEYGGDYGYVIYYKLNHLAVDHWNKGFKTYEEAELACLRKLIEIVNQNKDENK